MRSGRHSSGILGYNKGIALERFVEASGGVAYSDVAESKIDGGRSCVAIGKAVTLVML
jgi:hypothetical protein